MEPLLWQVFRVFGRDRWRDGYGSIRPASNWTTTWITETGFPFYLFSCYRYSSRAVSVLNRGRTPGSREFPSPWILPCTHPCGRRQKACPQARQSEGYNPRSDSAPGLLAASRESSCPAGNWNVSGGFRSAYRFVLRCIWPCRERWTFQKEIRPWHRFRGHHSGLVLDSPVKKGEASSPG